MTEKFDLSVIVTQYPQALTSRAKLAAVLHDLYPKEKYLTNLALAAYGSGAAGRIEAAEELDAMLVSVLARQLEDDYGLTEESAGQSIRLWIAAYGKRIPENTVLDQESAPVAEPALEKPPKEKTSSRLLHSIIKAFAPEEPEPEQPEKTSPRTDRNGSGSGEKAWMQRILPASNSETANVNAADYELEALADGTYAIRKYRGFGEENMAIPVQIDGKRISAIGKAAFKKCKEMKMLVVPEGITEIGQGAFEYCEHLENVSLPDSLQILGAAETRISDQCGGVFANTALVYVRIPENVKVLGENAFAWCSNLVAVDLPEGLTTIGYGTFQYCKNLEEIEIPPFVLKIPSSMFAECTNLSSVILPEGLEEIGFHAFWDCKQLTQIYIPDTVKRIDPNAFWGIHHTIIYCHAGTMALEWARENGCPFRDAAELR